MLDSTSFDPTWKLMTRAMRWSPYVTNWPVVLDALRHLWQAGKVSELKSPFYEPVEKPASM